jgi:hypothetical protein
MPEGIETSKEPALRNGLWVNPEGIHEESKAWSPAHPPLGMKRAASAFADDPCRRLFLIWLDSYSGYM